MGQPPLGLVEREIRRVWSTTQYLDRTQCHGLMTCLRGIEAGCDDQVRLNAIACRRNRECEHSIGNQGGPLDQVELKPIAEQRSWGSSFTAPHWVECRIAVCAG